MSVDNRKYWDDYYQNHFIADPSPFAEFCQESYLQEPRRIVEFGSGSGRDLCYFFQKGHKISGFDTSEEAVAHVLREHPTIDYQVADFCSLDPMEGIEAVYSRWTIHAIDERAEEVALKWAADSLVPGGIFLIEVRTVNDELCGQGEKVGRNSFITDHFRRFIEPDEFVSSLEALGFETIFRVESNGLSVYKGDDPTLLRIVARKK